LILKKKDYLSGKIADRFGVIEEFIFGEMKFAFLEAGC
jgi:hypothetical protein